MTAEAHLFVYPEELLFMAPEELAALAAELEVDAVATAVVYHRSRRVLPRHGTVSVLTRTTSYFEPDRSRYDGLVPTCTRDERLREALVRFRHACAREGIGFRAWIVALHDEELAAAFPDSASRLLDGSPSVHGLCPSSSAARTYAAALIEDVAAQLQPDAIDLEAALYPAWEPSYTLTLSLEPLTASAQLLGAQCFCPWCRSLIGPDADALVARARAAAGPPFASAVADVDDVAAELAAHRSRGVADLLAQAEGSARRAGIVLRVFASGSPERAAVQGAAGIPAAGPSGVLFGCGPLAGAELVDRYEGLSALVGVPGAVSMNWTPERAESYGADAVAALAAGAEGVALYNLSLVPDASLPSLRAAARSVKEAVGL
jgi:hypothetical protein